jgi:hypothetical protein
MRGARVQPLRGQALEEAEAAGEGLALREAPVLGLGVGAGEEAATGQSSRLRV